MAAGLGSPLLYNTRPVLAPSDAPLADGLHITRSSSAEPRQAHHIEATGKLWSHCWGQQSATRPALLLQCHLLISHPVVAMDYAQSRAAALHLVISLMHAGCELVASMQEGRGDLEGAATARQKLGRKDNMLRNEGYL